jgi:hypothetical protein
LLGVRGVCTKAMTSWSSPEVMGDRGDKWTHERCKMGDPMWGSNCHDGESKETMDLELREAVGGDHGRKG